MIRAPQILRSGKTTMVRTGTHRQGVVPHRLVGNVPLRGVRRIGLNTQMGRVSGLGRK